MDIAAKPTAPGGDIELSGAAVPAEPAVILRKDYTPFPWRVPETRLEFVLDPKQTTVVATMKVERNSDAIASSVLRLDGDALKAQSVKVDGELSDSWSMDGDALELILAGDAHEVEIVTVVDPSANLLLMGLYSSGGMLCTQCEAEGFRRITFFPDRPDVLSTYSVRMEGSKADYPILLCNGNMVSQGDLDEGRHYAEWHDPWPKPSYLFALVAGDLVANSSSFTTCNGREVELNVWVREEDLPRTDHAMESLIKSMKWDEEAFGREYDLDLYNIVAVSDFNMGAMENKGLNVFNTKYVLADPDTATDADFNAIEGVIGHEYFHNWSGNRITCQDWFQLSLKEGFTVLRDQLFSQDMQGEAVKRIEDVRVLRAAQFPEDSGPLAHPIRPDSYQEINNFYTATVYNKGAEVIRMMRTMCGPERFRQGTDLYFDQHDGEAATCEDFVTAIEDGAGLDLTQFRLWYSQAGTPTVTVSQSVTGTGVELTLKQKVPATPGQPEKQPVPIPLRVAVHSRQSGAIGEEQLIVLTKEEESFSLTANGGDPVVSLNRGFTAPIAIKRELTSEELVFLAAKDDDPFARYEALQELAVRQLVGVATGALDAEENAAGEAALIDAMRSILTDAGLDDSMRGELMMLPSQSYLMERIDKADPGAVHAAREGLRKGIAKALQGELEALYERTVQTAYADPKGRGARKVKTQALSYLAAADADKAATRAAEQFGSADNMTDRQGALMVLCGLDTKLRTDALLEFYNRYQDNDLVIDKWFSLQAWSTHPSVLEHVKALAEHPDFNPRNPNRVFALYIAFTGNPLAFHAASGEGYRMIADFILKLDPINAHTAARFVAPLGRWRKIEDKRAGMMKAELERILATPNLSRDVHEQVARSLG
ncbi:MAG: aminopeptidase N [Erythrobacter sp.]